MSESTDSDAESTKRVMIDTPGKSGFTGITVKTWETTANGGTRFIVPSGDTVTVSPTVDWILGDHEVMQHVE